VPIWVCVFDDDEQMLVRREMFRPKHHAYLREHAHEIIFAGALLPGEGTVPTGSLWILDVATAADVSRLVEEDPYYDKAHRSYRVSLWKFALDEHKVKMSGVISKIGK